MDPEPKDRVPPGGPVPPEDTLPPEETFRRREPEEVDDYDLEPPLPLDPARSRRRVEEDPGGIGFPMMLAAGAVLAIAVLGVLFLVFRRPTAQPATTSVPMPPSVATSRPSPSGAPLPSLEASDDFARGLAQALSSHPEVARWLAQNALVQRLTVVVDNVSNGETPRTHLEFLAPKERFRARRGARTTTPDPAGFKGYDAFADAIVSVDAGAAARAFQTLEPLFDEAYKELGHPEGGFRTALLRAIRNLLAVPVLREDVKLVPHATLFRYEDKGLEGLSAAQKQFLRLGPRNVRLVQGKLREVEQALSALPAT
jgi:hypothetical protein